MPIVRFRLATGGDKRDVECAEFRRTPGGTPECAVLNHPWCLAQGTGGPEACKFRRKPKSSSAKGVPNDGR